MPLLRQTDKRICQAECKLISTASYVGEEIIAELEWNSARCGRGILAKVQNSLICMAVLLVVFIAFIVIAAGRKFNQIFP